jgi:2-oxoglutarate dehydrogenase E1 component
LQVHAFPSAEVDVDQSVRDRVFDTFRRWGYLEANLDPLGHSPKIKHPELQALTGPAADAARKIYANTIGAEFMHIPDPERRQWIIDRLEGDQEDVDRNAILDALVDAETFEQTLQTLYIGTKRFSLEGNAALIPLLDNILSRGADLGAAECVMAMSHRGRLTVVAHTVGRTPAEIFAGFEDVDPRSTMGGGDVKYHMGATGNREFNGKNVRIHLVSNPSHLEAVDPVALGRVRAKQTRRGKDGKQLTFPVIMHGDAAFAGQGIWAETLNLSYLRGYNVGGTVNIIVNNLLGFTANPSETNSSLFASDIAKRLPIPIFHVNAEDPEAVVRLGRIAVEYRYKFGSDVVIDLIGFRRHGHSEVDDPTITQPLMYKRIKEHPPLYDVYAKQLGIDVSGRVAEFRARMQEHKKEAASMTKKPMLYQLPSYWDKYKGGPHSKAYEVPTGLSREEIASIGEKLAHYPADFNIHPKVKKLLDQRRAMAQGKQPFDYGAAEAIAFGSLAIHGTPIRMSGQDSRRGTFNHRHSALIDIENEREFVPLCHVSPNQARVEIYNSELSEAAVMGFEYGYSRDFPETLVMWEAQFGDFANGAQIVIDQFLSAGEEKWGLLSGVTLLLPHGSEGQGPEHSSARIERYLQLAARDNMVIAQPSNAAQYFHLLRRQALRPWRKPLVVFTPKSMLRHPEAVSPIDDLVRPSFLNVVTDTTVPDATRLIFCTGKIGHELKITRRNLKNTDTAINFIDQLYPWPEEELRAAIAKFPRAEEIVWVQEEPANMGALSFVVPRLRKLAKNIPVRSVKRSAAASPATGSAKAHEMEQKTLLTLAFAG